MVRIDDWYSFGADGTIGVVGAGAGFGVASGALGIVGGGVVGRGIELGAELGEVVDGIDGEAGVGGTFWGRLNSFTKSSILV